MTIVNSITKNDEKAVSCIALMRQTLESASTEDVEQLELMEDVQWRLKWFEEDYSADIDGPSY